MCELFSCYPTRHRIGKGPQAKHWKGSPVKYFCKSSKYPKSKFIRAFQILRGIINCFWFCITSAKKYDRFVFSCPRFIDSLLGLYLLSFKGGKIVVDQTELFSSLSRSIVHRAEESIIAAKTSQLFTISDNLKVHYRTTYDKSSIILPPVVDFDRFDPETSPERFTIGYVGSFSTKDDVPFIIKAFAKACEFSENKLNLILMGSPRNSQEYKELINLSSYKNNISLVLNPSESELNKCMSRCDTFIMNRTETDFAKYGYPTKLGEYFACKRVVLMSSGPGFSENFEHLKETVLYKADDLESLSKAILWRYSSTEKSIEIANRGYDFAYKNFRSEVVGKQFVTGLKGDEA